MGRVSYSEEEEEEVVDGGCLVEGIAGGFRMGKEGKGLTDTKSLRERSAEWKADTNK